MIDSELQREYDDLDFTNDLIFKEVMLQNKDICIEIIERCIGDIEIESLEFVESEYEIYAGPSNKRVRMDIVLKDNKKMYNVEMLTKMRRKAPCFSYGYIRCYS